MGDVIMFRYPTEYRKVKPCSDCRELIDVADLVKVKRAPIYFEVSGETIDAYVCDRCASEGDGAA